MQHAALHGAAFPAMAMELETHDAYIRLRVTFGREFERQAPRRCSPRSHRSFTMRISKVLRFGVGEEDRCTWKGCIDGRRCVAL